MVNLWDNVQLMGFVHLKMGTLWLVSIQQLIVILVIPFHKKEVINLIKNSFLDDFLMIFGIIEINLLKLNKFLNNILHKGEFKLYLQS